MNNKVVIILALVVLFAISAAMLVGIGGSIEAQELNSYPGWDLDEISTDDGLLFYEGETRLYLAVFETTSAFEYYMEYYGGELPESLDTPVNRVQTNHPDRFMEVWDWFASSEDAKPYGFIGPRSSGDSLTIHPPDEGSIVVGFKAPEDGDYIISELTVERFLDIPGETSLDLFDHNMNLLYTVQLQAGELVESDTDYRLVDVAKGQQFYLVVNSVLRYDGDALWINGRISFVKK